MAENKYAGMNLPELYLEAHRRGIKSFFPNDEKEMMELLTKWDSEYVEQPKLGEPANMAKEAAADELDDLLDVDAADAASAESDSAPAAAPAADAKAPRPTGRVDQPTTDDLSDILDEPIEESAEAAPAPTPAKPAKAKPAPAPIADKLDNDLDDILENGVTEPTAETTAPAPVKPTPKGKATMAPKAKPAPAPAPAPAAAPAPAPKAKAATAAPAKANPTEGQSPYQSSSAGHYVFIALTKGGTIEKVAANAAKLIAHFGAKPPSDMNAKIKIIKGEINAGKQDKKFGKFDTDDKGKITWVAA
jgi:hypothetical protein